MQEKGIPCDLRNNEILPSHINVVFGAHMMDPFFIYQLPKDTVVFNTEKLSEDNGQLVDTVCGFARLASISGTALTQMLRCLPENQPRESEQNRSGLSPAFR